MGLLGLSIRAVLGLGAKFEGCGCFMKLGEPFWGPHSEDYHIIASVLGGPLFIEAPRFRCSGHRIQDLGLRAYRALMSQL